MKNIPFLLLINYIAALETPYDSIACEAGTYGTETCYECDQIGTYCPYNSSLPIECIPGYYCPGTGNDAHCSCVATGARDGEIVCDPNWTIVQGSSWDCELRGNGTCSQLSDSSVGDVAWLGGSEYTCTTDEPNCLWENFTVSTIVEFPSDDVRTRYSAAAIMFRTQLVSQTVSNYIGYAMELSAHSDTLLLEYFLGESGYFGIKETDYNFEANVKYNFNFTVVGNTLNAWIDDEHVFESTWNSVPSLPQKGSIGLLNHKHAVTWHRIELEIADCIVPCDAGTFSNQTGASEVSACTSCINSTIDPGYYSNCKHVGTTNPVLECPKGFYCPGGVSPNAFAEPCDNGYITTIPLATAASDCERCPLGQLCYDSTVTICPRGMYCPDPAAEPIHCPIGTYNNNTGQSSLDACLPCEAGYYGCAKRGVVEQLLCPLGHYCASKFDSAKPVNQTCSCRVHQDSCGDPFIAVSSGYIESTEIHTNGDGTRFDFIDETIFVKFWNGGKIKNQCDSSWCSMSNFELEFSFELYEPEAINEFVTSSIGLLFRASAQIDLVGYSIAFFPKINQIRLFEWYENLENPINYENFNLDYHTQYNCRIVVQGGVFTVYMDGVLAATFYDETFTTGAWGFTSMRQRGVVHNITITGDDTRIPCNTPENYINACPAGQYQDELGKETCKSCPIGYDGCSDRGTSVIHKCPAGYACYGGESERLQCSKGTYGTGKDCYPCPPRTFSNAIGAESCQTCKPGIHRDCNCDPCYFYFNVTSCSNDMYRTLEYFTDDLFCRNESNLEAFNDMPCTWVPVKSWMGKTMQTVISVGIIFNIFILILIACNWNNPLIKACQKYVSIGLILGMMLSNCSFFLYVGDYSQFRCVWRESFLHLTTTLTLACIFAKIHRVYVLFVHSLTTNTKSLKDRVVMLRVLKIVLVDFLILIVVIFVDKPRMVSRTVDYKMIDAYTCPAAAKPQEEICEYAGWGYVNYLSYFYIAGLTTICCYMSWIARKLPNSFAEAKFVMFSMYNFALMVFMVGAITMLPVIGPVERMLLWSCGSCYVSVVSIGILFLPKFYRIYSMDEQTLKRTLLNELSENISKAATEPTITHTHMDEGSVMTHDEFVESEIHSTAKVVPLSNNQGK